MRFRCAPVLCGDGRPTALKRSFNRRGTTLGLVFPLVDAPRNVVGRAPSTFGASRRERAYGPDGSTPPMGRTRPHTGDVQHRQSRFPRRPSVQRDRTADAHRSGSQSPSSLSERSLIADFSVGDSMGAAALFGTFVPRILVPAPMSVPGQ